MRVGAIDPHTKYEAKAATTGPDGEILAGIYQRITDQAKRGALSCRIPGWIVSGELGRWLCDGALLVVGRQKELSFVPASRLPRRG